MPPNKRWFEQNTLIGNIWLRLTFLLCNSLLKNVRGFYFCEARILKYFLLQIRVTINLLFSRAAWYAKYLGPWANTVYPRILQCTRPQHQFSVCYTPTRLSLLQQSLHLEGQTSAAQPLSSSDPNPLNWKKKKKPLSFIQMYFQQPQPNSHCPVSPIPKSSHSWSSAMCFREPGNRKLCTRVYWRWWPHIPVGPQLGWGTQNWWVCKEHCSNLLMSHIADGTQYW